MVRFRKAAIPQGDLPPLLATLLKQRRFDEIYEVFQFYPHLEKWLGLSSKSISTASILHGMICADAPVHLIDLALVKLTELRRGECPVESMNSTHGQTALHIAVIHGADLTVIRRLTAHSTLAASSLDNFRRFPLHWACAGVSSSSLKKKKKLVTAAETVRYLLELFPEALMVKDCEGKTPYDLAVAHRHPQHDTLLLSLFQRRRPNQQECSVATTRIQVDLNTAMWKLLPSCRTVMVKGNGERKHTRMRFSV